MTSQQLVERDAAAGRDVDHFAGRLRRLARAQHAVDDVGDVGEVARLLAVAVDDRRRPSSSAVANSEMTPEYGEPGSWRGPKTLK